MLGVMYAQLKGKLIYLFMKISLLGVPAPKNGRSLLVLRALPIVLTPQKTSEDDKTTEVLDTKALNVECSARSLQHFQMCNKTIFKAVITSSRRVDSTLLILITESVGMLKTLSINNPSGQSCRTGISTFHELFR